MKQQIVMTILDEVIYMKEVLELYWAFFQIGIMTFGGGYAMLPMLQRVVVDEKKWATEEEVLDYYAIDLIHFLNENGFDVPKDISVAGFDDIPMCEMIAPTLTTVRQDGAMRAKIAIEKLQELKENRVTETTITLPVTLVERASTVQCEDVFS